MIVYRYTSEEELINILEKKTDNLGGHFSNSNSNTFKYNPNERYMHFFKKTEDLEHIRKLHNRSKPDTNFYYCAYDIPVVQLILSAGTGYYESSGYDTYYTSAREFAIVSKKFNPDWLVGYMRDDRVSTFDKSTFESKIKTGYTDPPHAVDNPSNI